MWTGDVLLGDGIFQATATDALTTQEVDISNGPEKGGMGCRNGLGRRKTMKWGLLFLATPNTFSFSSGWWFQMFFILIIPIWGNDPI